MIAPFATALLFLVWIVPSTAWSATESRPAQVSFDVTGFRSATFGMSVEDVLKAIREDFGGSSLEVDNSIHPIERTELLSVAVNDLLPVGGPARITYIIGFQSQALSQVNIVWGRLANNEAPQEELLAAGSLLTQHFSIREFPPEQTIQNQPMSDGSIVLFKGSDQENRTVLLRLLTAPRPQADDETNRSTDHDSLMLSYLREPEKPDAFRIEPGKF